VTTLQNEQQWLAPRRAWQVGVVTGIDCTLAEWLSRSLRAHMRAAAPSQQPPATASNRQQPPATASNRERCGPLRCAVLRFAAR
jgi:hypothetical protein